MKKLLLLSLLLSLVSCQPTTSTTRKSTTTSSNSNGFANSNNPYYWPTPVVATPIPNATAYPTPTAQGGICYARGAGDQTIEYYRISSIIAKGSRNFGQVLWSSQTDPYWSRQNVFHTDSRLNVRLVAKPSPGVVSGVSCPNQSMPYTKLQATVRVRAINSNYYVDSREIESSVGDCSQVAELRPPLGVETFAIDLTNVKWNYDCDVFYANALSSERAQYCPYAYVWPTECFQLELQFSTDSTRDLPR